MQNSVTIPQGVSFPYMREIAHQNVYSVSFLEGVLPTLHSQGPKPIFTRNTSNDAVPRKDMPFWG